ncbi:hypothetical protein [Streptomyces hygroscopicus]|uniref:hypothetical protein n=1 Tax=Streptomyces hygroscopicus TaxID=1912 RepID=UPI000767BCFE|nr:hypothetical protein [Streptomyces hygroscopicus]
MTTFAGGSVELALAHSARMPGVDGSRFMTAFEAARADVAAGRDTEERWLRLRASNAPAAPVVIAGYLEGLASVRRPGGAP